MSRAARPAFSPPTVAHVPGRTPRPPEDLFDPLKSGLSAGLSAAALAASPAFQGALEAFAGRYYWEAHELLEAVWTCLPPASAERHLVRGLIQLANAGLKARMGRAGAVARIRLLADKSIAEAFLHGHARLMGLTPADVQARARQVDGETVALQ